MCQKTISLIQEKGSLITRRSAGIPAIIIGILASEDSVDIFSKTLRDLHNIADSKVALSADAVDFPQVHALNCLKAIISSTKLAARVDQHIVSTLRLAARCLSSDVSVFTSLGQVL